MANTEKFTDRAAVYSMGRPNYADCLISYLYDELGFSDEIFIADIGCGTGKFAKQLLDKGSFVYGIEPNDDMRCVAERELHIYDKFKSVKGDASHTTLSDSSVDFVTAAQAFHWFDIDEFREECKRILKSDGRVILIWNTRDNNDEINKEVCELNKKFCPQFKGFSGGIKEDDERIVRFFNSKYEKHSFDNPLLYNEDKFISRLLSGSYSLKEGDKNYSEYIAEAKAIFKKYQLSDVVKMGNSTVAYIGCVSH